MAGLLDLFNQDPGSLYGSALDPQQSQALAFRGLLATAGALGQAAMPSRMPIPIGAALGTGAAAYGNATDEAAKNALQGGLLGAQGAYLRSKLNMEQQFFPALMNEVQHPPGEQQQPSGLLAPQAMPGNAGQGVQPKPNGVGSANVPGPQSPVMPGGQLQAAFWKIESGGTLNPPDGKAGEIGPMQIKPSTGAQYGASPDMLRDLGTNFKVGGAIINDLSQRYGGGRGRVQRRAASRRSLAAIR